MNALHVCKAVEIPNNCSQKKTLSDDTVCLSEHISPTILEGESCFSKSFHAVPESSEFLLSVVRELPEL